MSKWTLSPKERAILIEWASDGEWVESEEYQRDLDYFHCVKDILAHPVFQSMEEYIQHGGTTCRAHCIQVSYMAYQMCRAWGLDYKSAARAGLLHDLFLYDWHTHRKLTGECFHGFTHPRRALQNAVKYFELSDKEKDMILRHMWPLTPVPPKSLEGFTLLYADKFCSAAEVLSCMKGAIVGEHHDSLGRIAK